MDGSTSLALGPAFDVDDRPAFEGWLDTPGDRIAVWTMEWEKLVEMNVPTTRAEVRIWANDPSEPDDLYIGVGPPIADRSSIQNPFWVAPNLQHCAHRWGYTAFECAEINRIGRESGCAFCGSKEPHTKSGNFILDRQPNDVINPFLKGPQDLYPICRHCSFRQGLWLSRWQVQHNLCKTA